MAEIDALHLNLTTNLSVFTLKIGLQYLSFSTEFIGLYHNSLQGVQSLEGMKFPDFP